MKIEIDLQFGSKFQERTIVNLIEKMLKTIKSNFECYHRKNKMIIKYED